MNKEEFLKSRSFMKLGQAIEHGNWQIAIMTAQKMQRDAREAQITDFDRQLIMLKQCLTERKKTEAQNVLAAMVSIRVQLMEK